MSTFRSLWLRWKSLRLPWRKKILIGLDLQGNTYWVLNTPLPSRPSVERRIVQRSFASSKGLGGAAYAEMSITPSWHQWLRHTRDQPPSMEEQQADVLRQIQLKQGARLADERWNAKGTYVAGPKATSAQPARGGDGMPMLTDDVRATGYRDQINPDRDPNAHKTMHAARDKVLSPIGNPVNVDEAAKQQQRRQSDPWNNDANLGTGANPGDTYQPEAWDPGRARKS